MSLQQLTISGASQLLRRSIRILEERGWVKGVTRDIRSGQVDLHGALLLAAGVKVGQVNDEAGMETVPPARRAAYAVALEVLDAECDEDPIAWQDRHKFDDIIELLRRSATRLEIALR